MPIFDAHVHLWSHDAARFPSIPWHLTGGGTLPKVDGTAERLVDLMNDAGVSAALYVQVLWFAEDFRSANHQSSAAVTATRAVLAVAGQLTRVCRASLWLEATGTAQGSVSGVQLRAGFRQQVAERALRPPDELLLTNLALLGRARPLRTEWAHAR